MTINTVPESFLRRKDVDTSTYFTDAAGGSVWKSASVEFGARAIWDTPVQANVSDGGYLVERSARVTTKWNIQITEPPTVKMGGGWLFLHWVEVTEILGRPEPLIRVVVTGNNGYVTLLEGWSTAPSDRPLEEYGSSEQPLAEMPDWLVEIVEYHTGLELAEGN